MEEAINGFKALIQSRDWDGRASSRSVEVLTRASACLKTDWIRDFMLQEDRPSEYLSVLTSPGQVASGCTFQGIYESYGAPSLNCSLGGTCLLIPCCTVGKETVGIVVQQEGPLIGTGRDAVWNQVIDLESESMSPGQRAMGRFYLDNATGELLMLAKVVPGEEESFIKGAAQMASMSGEEVLTERGMSAPVTRLQWWSTIRGMVDNSLPLGNASTERLAAGVFSEPYANGRYSESLLIASHIEQTRATCFECSTRGQAGGFHGDAPGTRVSCSCRDTLAQPSSLLDYTKLARNIRRSQRGNWVGLASVVSNLFTRGAAVAYPTGFSMSLAFDGDVDMSSITAQLQSMAIDCTVRSANAPQLILPPLDGPTPGDMSALQGHTGSGETLADLELLDLALGYSPSAENESNLKAHTGLHSDEHIVGKITEGSLSAGDQYESATRGAEILLNQTGEVQEFVGIRNEERTPDGDVDAAASGDIGVVIGACNVAPCRQPRMPPVSGDGEEVRSTVSVAGKQAVGQEAGCFEKDDAIASNVEEKRRKAALRRQKNREAATRSNKARSARNQALKTEVFEARKRVSALREKEFELRAANIELRTQIELKKA